MTMGERIYKLRKEKSLSQEQLAETADVSRQAVSKWETGQSVPDAEKIVLLSDIFGTTTDYLLKGTQDNSASHAPRLSANTAAAIGTLLNFLGVISSVFIWFELQRDIAALPGLAALLIGSGIFVIGGIADSFNKKTVRYFLAANIWVILLIPLSWMFNFLESGIHRGFYGCFAPIPIYFAVLPRNVYMFWIFYFVFCTAADLIILKRKI